MNSLNFIPRYHKSLGFYPWGIQPERITKAVDRPKDFPPCNIEIADDKKYVITLAVPGFLRSDIQITQEKNVLTVSGKKSDKKEPEGERQYLHQGFIQQDFERQFNLGEYVEVTEAKLDQGLLTINLIKEIPEESKPRKIAIDGESTTAEVAASTSREEPVTDAH